MDDNVINLPVPEQLVRAIRIPAPYLDQVMLVICRDGKYAFVSIAREMLEDEGIAYNAVTEAINQCDHHIDELGGPI